MTTLIRPAVATIEAPAPFGGTPWAAAAAAAHQHSPYLRRLIERRDDLFEAVDEDWPERVLQSSIAGANAIAADPPPMDEAMRILRRGKQAVHLAIAIADLARAWPLMRVTAALTQFADAALAAAVALGVRDLQARGELLPAALDRAEGPAPGFTLIAMGKMGAGELNYSSDIDFSVFFEPTRLPVATAREPRVVAVRMVAPIVRALEEITADGYVFRTDLRLRPDPGSTPVAVSIDAAAHYYQTLGQNWERAAFIKARAAAGDQGCGAAFLRELEPYIWRKHLDFAAVADVKSIKRQILSAHKSADLNDPVFDVKLGRGGIRDIELFVQTQQLILGGRNKKLRVIGTLAGLEALAEAEAISAEARDALSAAYVFFRDVEHRIQMLEDGHTHRVPADPDTRARVAALAGFETNAAFEAALIEQRRIVSDIDHQLFGGGESLADPLGSLIFTGVEDDPETLKTIARLGYEGAGFVSQTIRGWHHGRIRAMRAERARELLTTLTPKMLRAFSATGEPDQAFLRFSLFFGRLSAGVQVLALLDARPTLLELLARLFALAPKLAERLARRPSLLDAMVEPRFSQPLTRDAPGGRLDDLRERLADADSFEARLNEARRFQSDEGFRIGVQVLEGAASAEAAGAAHADLAEACVIAMAEVALAEVTRTSGAAPGVFTVLALGKFGGRELAEGSDLDLMLVYDATAEANERGLMAGEYFARLTQRLISALSAPTEAGLLYEIDAKLRPSGSKGPVAVRLSSFERYYEQEAWTWELQALTRLRPVAGDAALGARVQALAHAVLARPRDVAKTLGDVADMRARMERERRPRGAWDLKLAPGGLVDVEFIAQALQLTAGTDQVLSPNTGQALSALAAHGSLDPALHQRLSAAWLLWGDLQQTLRICVEGEFDPSEASPALQAKLAQLAGSPDFEALEARVEDTQANVRAAFVQLVGPLTDGTAPLGR
ncbi:glutamate-ammonia-ligase adenylyltransferase [alpha proteobacterium U9-1i]|nr:glutamate-ammonia-ligase adenylyltransferase [alpha proteobacterium U9-1i]